MGEIEKHVDRRVRILDYGRGYGRSIRELHERGFANLFVVDYSSGMIGQARKEHPFAQHVRNSGSEIPFSDGSFEAVLLLGLLTCIPGSGAIGLHSSTVGWQSDDPRPCSSCRD